MQTRRSTDSPPEQQFNVGALSLGYIRDFVRFGKGTLGIGAMGTLNLVPSTLEPAYGSRMPLGAMLFLRVRPFRSPMSMQAMSAMPGMGRRSSTPQRAPLS